MLIVHLSAFHRLRCLKDMNLRREYVKDYCTVLYVVDARLRCFFLTEVCSVR